MVSVSKFNTLGDVMKVGGCGAPRTIDQGSLGRAVRAGSLCARNPMRETGPMIR